MQLEYTKQLLKILGFTPKVGKVNVWEKNYSLHVEYAITININEKNIRKSIIDYGPEIEFDRATTCNFSKDENLVVLECIDRLLEKGYPPNRIYLEKHYPLGSNAGYLDINVLDEQGKSYLMVECKTEGKEYRRALDKLENNSENQLFSYFVQDKNTKYIALYASRIIDGKLAYKCQ